MCTSLGKMLLISNDLEACKLLNQHSLPLSSSLKFALFLCQVFRQASLKPSSDLQRYAHIAQCILEKGGADMELGLEVLSPTQHSIKGRKGQAYKFPCQVSSCCEL